MVQHKYRITRPFAIHNGEITSIKGLEEKKRIDRKKKNYRKKVIGANIPSFYDIQKTHVYKPVKKYPNTHFYYDYSSRKYNECQTVLTTELVEMGYLDLVNKKDRWGTKQPEVKHSISFSF